MLWAECLFSGSCPCFIWTSRSPPRGLTSTCPPSISTGTTTTSIFFYHRHHHVNISVWQLLLSPADDCPRSCLPGSYLPGSCLSKQKQASKSLARERSQLALRALFAQHTHTHTRARARARERERESAQTPLSDAPIQVFCRCREKQTLLFSFHYTRFYLHQLHGVQVGEIVLGLVCGSVAAAGFVAFLC